MIEWGVKYADGVVYEFTTRGAAEEVAEVDNQSEALAQEGVLPAVLVYRVLGPWTVKETDNDQVHRRVD